MPELLGLHHVTAVSASAAANHRFYTRVLGMRLVKRTVNQDDTSAYHLFYADALASPGSDLTFFEFPVAPEVRGTGSVARTGLRVGGAASLAWWDEHLTRHGVPHGEVAARDGRLQLDFDDPEGQRLALVADDGDGPAHPWDASPVPPEHQVRGLGPVTMSVADGEATHAVLTGVMGMRRARDFDEDGRAVRAYAMGAGGAAAELHVRIEPDAPPVRPGAGGVHHVAFRCADADYDAWTRRLGELGVPFSGAVDRYYFRSLYFRDPGGVLFEIATDGPGFAVDEPLEALGERLSLPPFLEGRRAAIERRLRPL